VTPAAGSGPASWLLNGRTGWRTAFQRGMSVGPSLGLAAAQAGPRSLGWPGGSLGGLTLPGGVATDRDGRIYVLGRTRIRRLDPLRAAFVPLPGIGGRGTDARRLRRPRGLAIAGQDLYVADTGHARVMVFALDGLALRHVWRDGSEPSARAGVPTARPWWPVDVAAHGDAAYLLDQRHGRVYVHPLGAERLRLVVANRGAAGVWARLAVDRQGRLYLFNLATRRLDVYDRQGASLGQIADADDIRDRFDPPAVSVDHMGRLQLRAGAGGLPAGTGGLLVDREGRPARVRDSDPPLPPSYLTSGSWISSGLDSAIEDCQWHRIELWLGQLPPGTRIRVLTHAGPAPGPGTDLASVPDELWDTHYAETGAMQPPDPSGATFDGHRELLVQSHAARYLWLRIVLEGDGSATPALNAVRVHYPRDSYLSYLPAVYSADDDNRWFLERFLSIFQTDWDELQRTVATSAQFFDPAASPAGAALAYLADWLAVRLEGTWSTEQNRRLLEAAPANRPRRGTIAGLRAQVRVYLENLTGLSADELTGQPVIVESFRERDHLMLSTAGVDRLGAGPPLWSPSAVGRLQLGSYATVGEAQLVSVGDPEHDLFGSYAHRFSVFVPAAWVPDLAAERMIRRVLNREKPAHTQYELCLVEPRLRVGVQSTVGVDTIVGAYPASRLAGAGADSGESSSRAPSGRLGFDTLLTGRARARPQQIGHGDVVGATTTVT
jgi:phage tail-like protein